MAEKKQFVQVVDHATGRVERVIELDKLERLSPEDKLSLSKGKDLFLVTHVIEPVIKIEMKKRLIDTEMNFHREEEEVKPEVKPEAKPVVKPEPTDLFAEEPKKTEPAPTRGRKKKE